jgi:EAL domain-containing protein (putative c-di-GMP-specific phosphodiesterase class I)
VRCRLALDRFDGEPSTREVLAALPFDFAKLAPSLTHDLAGGPARTERLRTALALLTGRGVKSVATGIEDAQSLAHLWTAGVDYAQGFFLHEPTEVIAYEEGG